MNRRDTLATLAALAAMALPADVGAQATPGKRPFRIGFAYRFPASSPLRADHVALMRHFGWVEHRDFVMFDSDVPFGATASYEAAQKVLEGKPDLIIVLSTAQAVAVHRLTKTVPIVMFGSGYPVEAGVAGSLARPGKNVTGNTLYAGTGIWGKLLQLLRESKPGAKRVAVLWTYVPPAFPAEEIEPGFRDFRQDAAALGMSIQIVEVATEGRLAAALKEIAAGEPDVLFTTSITRSWEGWTEIMNFAIARKLPTIIDYEALPGDTRPQALMSYSPSRGDLLKSTYTYVDRILRGAKPGDLPIQQPARFLLTVNLPMAKAIGLEMPPSLLARADRVIE